MMARPAHRSCHTRNNSALAVGNITFNGYSLVQQRNRVNSIGSLLDIKVHDKREKHIVLVTDNHKRGQPTRRCCQYESTLVPRVTITLGNKQVVTRKQTLHRATDASK